MDVQWFLEQRTDFLRYYYQTAAHPFLEIQRKIEAHESPYDAAQHGDFDEPPYLEEWSTAADALDVLGRSCVSILSATMQFYFQEWERELHVGRDTAERKKAFKDGILSGYRYVFEQLLNEPWTDCPADLAILEQVTLARNNDQHSSNITTIHAYHQAQDRKKHPELFFVSEIDRRMLAENPDSVVSSFLYNQVNVSEAKLFKVIDEMEKLSKWLSTQLEKRQRGGFPVKGA